MTVIFFHNSTVFDILCKFYNVSADYILGLSEEK